MWIRLAPRSRVSAEPSRMGSSLSLLIGLKSETILIRGISNSINYELNRVRFIAPVPAGSRIRARFTLARLQQIPDGAYQLT
jgi:acyl dehydratase